MIAIGLFVVVGCGGAGGGAATAAPGSVAPNATAGSPTTAPVASAQPPASQGSGGGGAAVGVCELVTPAELAGLFSVPSVKTTVLTGPPDTCIVQSDTGDDLTGWTLSLSLAKGTFDAMTTDPSRVDVSGIGDKAAIVQNTGLLVLKGDALLVITISGGANRTEEEAIVIAKQIGTIAAGRM